jgi:4-hydroxy-3-polyprenylbenzoate decarboxylase
LASERLVVGVSGGSGPIMAVRLLQFLHERAIFEVHLVATPAAVRTLSLESPEWPWERVKDLAQVVHDPRDVAAAISSGSFRTRGMVVIPASMNTVSAIASGIASNLLVRAADVTLKERRTLVVVPRETPLHLGHLRSMVQLAEMGACVLPPMVAFYHRPRSVQDVIDHVVGKVLDQFGIDHDLFRRWEGPPQEAGP